MEIITYFVRAIVEFKYEAGMTMAWAKLLENYVKCCEKYTAHWVIADANEHKSLDYTYKSMAVLSKTNWQSDNIILPNNISNMENKLFWKLYWKFQDKFVFRKVLNFDGDKIKY